MTTTFAELGLSAPVLKAVEKMGFTTPTPVQEQAIPALLEGRDVCAAAATGTGKTAAFLLPALSKLEHYNKGEGPRMLVVSPTRELAEQIGKACFPIAVKTKHYMLTVTGGTKYGPQIKALHRGIDVLIATPGRLNDLRERGVVDLKSVDLLVLDEADRMLDMGFWPDIESILEEVPAQRQTALFSATFDHSIMNKVDKVLNNPVKVEISHHGDTAESVDQYVMPIENKNKQKLLQAMLGEKGAERVIVFARTKRRADECAQELHDADFIAESIHSDKTQDQRRKILKRFSKGDTKVLVATDVLARGIDVPNVDYVVNYDLPDMPEDYVHRIGRTGRAGNDGFAVSFSTAQSRNELTAIQNLIKKTLPVMEIDSYAIDTSILEPKKRRPRDQRRSGSGGKGKQRVVNGDRSTPHGARRGKGFDGGAIAGKGNRGESRRFDEGRDSRHNGRRNEGAVHVERIERTDRRERSGKNRRPENGSRSSGDFRPGRSFRAGNGGRPGNDSRASSRGRGGNGGRLTNIRRAEGGFRSSDNSRPAGNSRPSSGSRNGSRKRKVYNA